MCLISFSWEFKSQALELYEAAPLHSHIGRLYKKCTHNYAFQQTYAICLLRGKPHPTTFILMVQVLLPLGMYLLSSTSITLTVYFHHWTQDLTLIKCELSFHHWWLIRYGLVPHPLMMSSLYLVISKNIISLSILSSKNRKIFQL